jgi:hypothetical protein
MNQLRCVTGICERHHLKKYLVKLGLINSSTCEMCQNIDKTASYYCVTLKPSLT